MIYSAYNTLAIHFSSLWPVPQRQKISPWHSSALPNGQRDALDIALQYLPAKTGQGTERNENKTARRRLLPGQTKPVLRRITRFPRKTAAKNGLAYNF
jgi:hypothetical protein